MERHRLLLFLIPILYLGVVFFAHRALFFSHFDKVYWKDKYEHSQWKLPLSERTLGDDGLYLYEGYRLIHGDDPTTLNAEVPPLAKYFIGTSILVFDNGYLYGFIATTLALLVFFLLARTLGLSVSLSLGATMLVGLDPLIIRQFSLTMLESLQLMFLLLSILAAARAAQTTNNSAQLVWTSVAGLSLGFFAEVKFPLFAPIVAVSLIIPLLKAKNRVLLTIVFLASAASAYLAPYIPYFLQGNTFWQWLGVQKWIVAFYAHSGLRSTLGSVVTTLLFNRNQNLFTRNFEAVPEWSPVWTLVTILGLIGLLSAYRRGGQKRIFFPIVFILISLFIFNAIIPFWTRYLVCILPFLYLGSVFFLKTVPNMMRLPILVLLLFVNVAFAVPALFPTPKNAAEQFFSDWKHGFFQDMYAASTFTTTQTMDRTSFHRLGRQIWYDAQIESADLVIEPYRWNIFASPQYVPVRITYKTRNLGIFDERHLIPFVREHGAWRVSWSWDLLLDTLTPTSTIQTSVIPARRGSLFAKDGTPLVEDKDSVLVWLLPNSVEKQTEEALFASMETVFEKRIKAVHFHERYVRLGELGLPVPMGVIMRPLDSQLKSLLTKFPAITTTPTLGRFTIQNDAYETGHVANLLFTECCSLLYTTSSYEGVDGLEKTYNATLRGENGGTLKLKNADGSERIIIEKTKRDGVDVRQTQ